LGIATAKPFITPRGALRAKAYAATPDATIGMVPPPISDAGFFTNLIEQCRHLKGFVHVVNQRKQLQTNVCFGSRLCQNYFLAAETKY